MRNDTDGLFTFPNPVNEVSARLVAVGVVLLAFATLALDQPWLLIPLAYGFVARALTGPSLSPLGQLVTRVVTPRLAATPRYVAGPPKGSLRRSVPRSPSPPSSCSSDSV